MIGHCRRFWKKNMHVKSIVDSGVIGKIVLLKQLELRPKNFFITREHSYRTETDPLGYMLAGGGHSVDLFRWFLRSNIKRVFAVGRATKGAIYPGSDAFDHAKAMFAFEDGSSAFIEVNDIAPRDCPYYFPIFEIVGTKGKIDGSDYSTVSVSVAYDQKLWVPFARAQFLAGLGTPYVDELQYFVRCVLEDREPDYMPLEDARAVVEAVVAANMSMKQGEPVDLPF
jgi:myo-inositol 2-dehydrogenase/D-chiro-inositol 1-dehydrogenase